MLAAFLFRMELKNDLTHRSEECRSGRIATVRFFVVRLGSGLLLLSKLFQPADYDRHIRGKHHYYTWVVSKCILLLQTNESSLRNVCLDFFPAWKFHFAFSHDLSDVHVIDKLQGSMYHKSRLIQPLDRRGHRARHFRPASDFGSLF